jgi:hypothetical protein
MAVVVLEFYTAQLQLRTRISAITNLQSTLQTLQGAEQQDHKFDEASQVTCYTSFIYLHL